MKFKLNKEILINENFIEYNRTGSFDNNSLIKNKVSEFYNKYPFPNINFFQKIENKNLQKIEINRIHDKIMKSILQKAKLEIEDIRNKEILDAGCGCGEKSIYLAINGAKKIVGIDISKKSIEIANKSKEYLNLKNVEFFNQDLEELIFENTFDLCLCIGVINHVYEHEKIINNLSRSVKKEGIIIIGFYSMIHRIPYFLKKFFLLRKYKDDENYINFLKAKYKENYLVLSYVDNYLHVYEKAFRIGYIMELLKKNNFTIINKEEYDFLNTSKMLLQGKYFVIIAGQKYY
ncbi:MAG: class I SAM-dependent methyltransferase [Candidatus Anstonellales archaeon]